VPVRYGDASRNAQTIIQENSRNSLPSTPLMTFYITGLDYEQSRMQDPYFVSRINVRQRTYDPSTETYETTQGNAFSVERLMPVPFKLTINLRHLDKQYQSEVAVVGTSAHTVQSQFGNTKHRQLH
jgi:hypothetical protein